MKLTDLWRAVEHRVHRRVRVRRSTLIITVLFVGLGVLYLQVRSEPRRTTDQPTAVVVSTTVAPTTTATAEPSTSTVATVATASTASTASTTASTTRATATTAASSTAPASTVGPTTR